MLTQLLVAAVATQSVIAFTNGTLLPPYLCDLKDQLHGAPQSLAQVIPLLQEDDAQAKIAGYHKVENNSTGYASQNLCTAEIINNAAFGAENKFIVRTKGGEPLLGLIVWIQDNPPTLPGPRRIGQITDPGLNMMLYPYRCGQTIVHSTVLDDDAKIKSQTDPFTWKATDIDGGIYGGQVEVRGICVTDNGFGKFKIPISTGGWVGPNTGCCGGSDKVYSNGLAPPPQSVAVPPAANTPPPSQPVAPMPIISASASAPNTPSTIKTTAPAGVLAGSAATFVSISSFVISFLFL
ncbi:UNVERIFIED_CONTAM: hypothetical protein HDU68_012119 [Siphonaria sp. JEL0065]|nr:hypothetical protein HDU68_012119 [Siphonaria sp. JEL0065]